MKLTRNFSLSELIKSDTAIRLGIDNNPNADQIEKLKKSLMIEVWELCIKKYKRIDLNHLPYRIEW